MVRPLARPLIRLGVRPNQITAAHLVIGLATMAAIAWGSPLSLLVAGFVWLFLRLLDCLDGEVARIGDMCSPEGHKFDCFVDTTLSSLYFLALGFSLRDMAYPYGWIAVGCGVAACASMLVLNNVAESFDSQSDTGGKILASHWGFDADDALCLLAPVLWLPAAWRFGAILLAALATGAFLLLFISRWAGLKRRLAATAMAPPAE